MRPVASSRLEPDARVAHLRRADQLVQGELMSLGDRQEQFETGLPLPCLQAGEGALRDSGQCGKLSQGEASADASLLQPGTDFGENSLD